jgi:uracil-DNA glycosylase
MALGRIGFDAYLQLLKRQGVTLRPRPDFAHGSVHALPNGRTLLGCYHPSLQNTRTGRLTSSMMDDVLARVRPLFPRTRPRSDRPGSSGCG